ncbi:MAG: NYN domain-containing protein [Actinomycetota bacterium]|nr:NYN domain-containing protein [Actinomycetota bacterium]
MAYRTRVFIDFWNFALQWRDRAPQGARIDWPQVPRVLLDEGKKKLEVLGLTDELSLEETLVYASYNPMREGKLKGWLDSFLDKQPSFRVKTRERREKSRTIHCSNCNHENASCESCGSQFRWAPEKGVDTAIVTDLLSLASEGAFDVAVLLSSDADHVPAVEWVQEKGLKVINATWANHGFDLAKTCWASVELDSVTPLLTR